MVLLLLLPLLLRRTCQPHGASASDIQLHAAAAASHCLGCSLLLQQGEHAFTDFMQPCLLERQFPVSREAGFNVAGGGVHRSSQIATRHSVGNRYEK
jgi:hypothetical protein